MEIFSNAIYIWLSLACIFIIIELLTFSLLFLSLAIASATMAIIVFIFPNNNSYLDSFIFSLLCIVSTVIWFIKLKGKKGDNSSTINDRANAYVGKKYSVSHSIINGIGKLKVGDSYWQATAEVDIEKGEIVKVISTKGTILKVETESDNECQ